MAPSYEISLLIRSLEKDALQSMLRKASKLITSQGGVVRDVTNAGNKVLPYRMKSHMQYAQVGRYAYLTADMSPRAIQDVSHRLKNDSNLIRHNVVKLEHLRAPKLVKKGAPTSSLDAYTQRMEQRMGGGSVLSTPATAADSSADSLAAHTTPPEGEPTPPSPAVTAVSADSADSLTAHTTLPEHGA